MENLYPYTTPEQQIEKLKAQQLTFLDEKTAKHLLKTYGYYNIINGYRDPYIIREYGIKRYIPGTVFEQIFALFILDSTIRDGVLMSMISLEEHLRAVVADIVAESFGTNHHVYLQNNNYRDKYVTNPRFRRNSILNELRKTAEESYIQPIRYYRETHQAIPPWILLKGAFFATLVNYVRFFKAPQREKLIYALYGDNISPEKLSNYKDILSDSLAVCLEYRNLAAHGGRIYNYIPKSNIRYLENTEFHKGLSQLMQVLNLFNYKVPAQKLDAALMKALNSYCPVFPDDVELLEKAIGFHIYREIHVWINEKTQKYHSDQHCSGANLYVQIPLENAKQQGLIPCKRCCKNLE